MDSGARYSFESGAFCSGWGTGARLWWPGRHALIDSTLLHGWAPGVHANTAPQVLAAARQDTSSALTALGRCDEGTGCAQRPAEHAIAMHGLCGNLMVRDDLDPTTAYCVVPSPDPEHSSDLRVIRGSRDACTTVLETHSVATSNDLNFPKQAILGLDSATTSADNSILAMRTRHSVCTQKVAQIVGAKSNEAQFESSAFCDAFLSSGHVLDAAFAPDCGGCEALVVSTLQSVSSAVHLSLAEGSSAYVPLAGRSFASRDDAKGFESARIVFDSVLGETVLLATRLQLLRISLNQAMRTTLECDMQLWQLPAIDRGICSIARCEPLGPFYLAMASRTALYVMDERMLSRPAFEWTFPFVRQAEDISLLSVAPLSNGNAPACAVTSAAAAVALAAPCAEEVMVVGLTAGAVVESSLVRQHFGVEVAVGASQHPCGPLPSFTIECGELSERSARLVGLSWVPAQSKSGNTSLTLLQLSRQGSVIAQHLDIIDRAARDAIPPVVDCAFNFQMSTNHGSLHPRQGAQVRNLSRVLADAQAERFDQSLQNTRDAVGQDLLRRCVLGALEMNLEPGLVRTSPYEHFNFPLLESELEAAGSSKDDVRMREPVVWLQDTCSRPCTDRSDMQRAFFDHEDFDRWRPSWKRCFIGQTREQHCGDATWPALSLDDGRDKARCEHELSSTQKRPREAELERLAGAWESDG